MCQILNRWIFSPQTYGTATYQRISTVFEIFRDRNLKFWRKKQSFSGRSWSGAAASDPHMAFATIRVTHLCFKNCASHMNGGELYEYFRFIGWMRHGIPNHARRVAPLCELLEVDFKKTEKRTRRSIKGIPLSIIGWNTAHNTYFHDLRSSLSAQLHLAHRTECLQLCIFTDAGEGSGQAWWRGVKPVS